MNNALKLTTLMSGKKKFTYSFRDEFTSAVAAPFGESRICEPGPGAWTTKDTANHQSVGVDGLTVGAAIATYDPNLDASESIPPVQGTAVVFRVKKQSAGKLCLYWKRVGYAQAFVLINQVINCPGANSDCGVGSPGTDWNSYYFVYDIGNSSIIAIYNNRVAAILPISGGDECLPSIGAYVSGGLFNCDYVRVGNLGGMWSLTGGIITSKSINPASGTILSSEADAVYKYVWAWYHGDQQDLYIRRLDDNNSWIVRLNKTTDTVKLIKIESGIELEVASAALSLGGYNPSMRVSTDGQEIRVYARDDLKITYTTASFNLTQTGSKLSGQTTGDIQSILVYPRYISGTNLVELKKLG